MAADICRGVSKNEQNGTSLVNYASVDAMKDALQWYKDEGIPASDITVISLYSGNKEVALKKFDKGTFSEISSADAFQRLQNHIIFVDYVSARKKSDKDRALLELEKN